MAQSKITLALSLALAAGFIFFGVQKFGGENIVFETIAQRSGFSFFDPFVRMFTGVTELAVALLLLIPRTRLLGALGGAGLLVGAIGFHLSPWLGINVPTIGHFLFIAAVTMLIGSLINLAFLRKPQTH
ncbi:MAG: MauE/DoxX family redox-associated membrane protein [Hellea sp.]